MRIGFIGTGTMGALMAANLVKKGYEVTGYDIVAANMEKAAALGVKKGSGIKAVAADSDIVITMLPESKDTKCALLDPGGAAEAMRPGMTVIDMCTGSPTIAKEIAAALAAKEIAYIDAPVSGGVAKASEGTLSIIASGDEQAYQTCLPLLQAMGEEVFYVGKTGNGQTIKLINNMLTGINLVGICEGMVLGMKAGIDPKLLLQVINSSSGESYSSRVKMPGFVFKRNFNGGFKARLQHKDMNLATTLARELQVPVIMGVMAQQYFLAALSGGRGEEDASVIVTLLESITGTEVKL
ncbi:MAG: NAD(P)-dependent oxidoreductase [Clostridiales bacterium]